MQNSEYQRLEEQNRLFEEAEEAQRQEEEEAARAGDSDQDPGRAFLYRLFVGWVPKHYDEKDLTPLFNQFGVVKDIIVLREKLSGQKRGCAFVSYGTKEEAELAIQNLDRQLQLPGALSLLEVRFAKSHQYVQAGAGPQDNKQLFFTSAPVQLGEPEISTFFSQFGVVEEVNLFRERKTGNSKGCGFITFQTRDQAVRAMDALENKSAEPSKDMSVQWADPELQFKKKKALEESNADNRMLFFAKVLRSASEEEVKRLFAKYGKVYDVNLFRAFQGAPTTKGCGLVTMGTHEEARAAIEGLDGKYCWDGLDSPMVVKWMDAALQRRRREQHLAAMLQGLVPSMAAGPADAWMPQPGGVPALARGGLPQALLLHEPEVGETPPAGCMPDAIKLFVGNIPKVCTEEQLLPFFETLGKVAELVIVRDKASYQSKGSAFVWYVSRAHAERAILQFNLRHVLPDPTGEQDRPLVVRKARVRAAKLGMQPGIAGAGLQGGLQNGLSSSVHNGMQGNGLHGSMQGGLHALHNGMQGPNGPKLMYGGSAMGQHPAVTMITGNGGVQHMLNLQGATSYYAPGQAGGPVSGSKIIQGPSGLGPLDSLAIQHNGVSDASAGSYLPVSAQNAGYRTVQQMPGAQLVSIQAAPSVSESGLYEAYGPGTSGDPMERYMIATSQSLQHGGGGGNALDSVALSIPLTLHQLGLVNNHLYSVQSMSGAQLNITPGHTPGVFHLLISGSKGQVEGARGLVSQVLGQQIL